MTDRYNDGLRDGRAQAFREAADVARWHERTLRTNQDAYDLNGANAVMCVADAIEALARGRNT